jgi:glutaredoxin 3
MTRIIVYSKQLCPNCDQVKALLKSKNIDFKEINIETNAAGRDVLIERGLRSVPQVFDGELLIGGVEKVKDWISITEVTSQLKLFE